MSGKTITLQQAMATLRDMFPTLEDAVLKTVIYQTGGVLERSIEILLRMQEADVSQNLPPGEEQQPMNMVSQELVATSQQTTGTKTALQHNLPDDFLSYVPSSGGGQQGQQRTQQLQQRAQQQQYQQPSAATYGSRYNDYSDSGSRYLYKSTSGDNSNISSDRIRGNVKSSNASTNWDDADSPSLLDQFSDYAKKKFREWKEKLSSSSNSGVSNGPQGQQYTSLLGNKPDSDEEEMQEFKR